MATKQANTAQRQTITKVFAILTAVFAAACVALAGLAAWGGSYATTMVRDELAAQKISFPADLSDYPDIEKYAGKTVGNGQEAKAYASLIGYHLEDVAGGQTYSEVSAQYQKDTTNAQLAGQRQALFMGESLRGILLGTGFAYGLIGQVAIVAAWVLVVLALVLLSASVVLFRLAGRR